MRRTARRPIPSGRIQPGEALAFGVTLSVASVIILALATNLVAASVLALSIAYYVVVYTMWLKPRTPQNIVIGGAAGAFPPLIGWAAVTGDIGVMPVLLFAIVFLWTPPHFWALALYACKDYGRAGIPMLPVVAGARATRRQIMLYTVVLAAVSVLPWLLGYAGPVYGLTAVVLGIGFLAASARVWADKQDATGVSLTNDAPARARRSASRSPTSPCCSSPSRLTTSLDEGFPPPLSPSAAEEFRRRRRGPQRRPAGRAGDRHRAVLRHLHRETWRRLMQRNTALAAGLGVFVAAMTGLAFASVPLYRAFCAATGYAGTPQIGTQGPTAHSDRTITIALNADINPQLPWSFAPERPTVTLKLGEEQMAFFDAKNLSTQPIEGVALYNVTPDTVGQYFHKTQCFCFNAQTLQPGEAVQMPVTFWVDPAIATDPDTRDVKTITLSYTFFRSLKDAEKSGDLAKAGPHTGTTGPVRILTPGGQTG